MYCVDSLEVLTDLACLTTILKVPVSLEKYFTIRHKH